MKFSKQPIPTKTHSYLFQCAQTGFWWGLVFCVCGVGVFNSEVFCFITLFQLLHVFLFLPSSHDYRFPHRSYPTQGVFWLLHKTRSQTATQASHTMIQDQMLLGLCFNHAGTGASKDRTDASLHQSFMKGRLYQQYLIHTVLLPLQRNQKDPIKTRYAVKSDVIKKKKKRKSNSLRNAIFY